MIAMSATSELKATILHFYDAEKWRIGKIVSQLHISRTTVTNILAQAGLLDARVAQRATLLDPYWPYILQILEEFPSLPASRLYNLVCTRGYGGGAGHFRHTIALYRQGLTPAVIAEIQPPNSELHNGVGRDEPHKPTSVQKCKSEPVVWKSGAELDAEILHAYMIYKWPTSTIANQLKVHRNKVDRVIAEAGYPQRRCFMRSTYMTPYEPLISQLFNNNPMASTKRVYAILQEQGYPGNFDHFRHYVDIHRPKFDANEWLLSLLQRKIDASAVKRSVGEIPGFDDLINRIYAGKLHDRNRSIVILASHFGLSITDVCNFLGIPYASHIFWLRAYRDGGVDGLFSRKALPRRSNDASLKEAIFSHLHEPPSKYGFNRTTWTMALLKRVLLENGLVVSPGVVREITRAAGYKWRKARIVLTSNDPDYSQKISRIHSILEGLQSDEVFFSIDEYGPFAVKIQGGLSLVAPGEHPTVPQWQKSHGSLIVTAALELSSVVLHSV
jgi:transposase